MESSSALTVIARFDRFQIDLSSGELRKADGTQVRIQQQPLQVLRLLLDAQGKVVSREQLKEALWSDDTFVDFEHGVNTAVKKLRQALGDSVESPKFVGTVPKVGYRFLIPVEWVPGADEIQTPPDELGVASVNAIVAEPSHRQRWLTTKTAVVTGMIVMLVLASAFLYRSPLLRPKVPEPSLSLAVTAVGEKYSPSLSPDGRELAFSWNGASGPFFSIYMKLIGTEEPIRLTKQESIDFNPVWSPDGRYIAFCRIQKGATGIYIVPALGGAERKVRDTHWEEREFYEVFWYYGRLSWSADGKSLAFSDRANRGEPTSIYMLSLDSLAVRRLTFASGSPGDYNPAFSPDGETLAFNRGSQGITAIYTKSVAGGEEHRVTAGSQFGWGLAWTANGRDIVFGRAAWLGRSGWLWKVSFQGGEPERLQFGQEGSEPSIRGNRLAYARQIMNLNIWKRQLDSSHPTTSEKFLTSTTTQSGPQFSPDGSMIAFESTRSGAAEIWICRSDGTNFLQLTRFNTVTGTPRWSPDGHHIAFDSRATGNAEIFVMDSGGGLARKLTNEPSTDVIPSWSRDGRWIYFASDRSGNWQVWKMPSAGGAAIQVTHQGGYGGFESLDGKFLYYAKGATTPGLWRIPTSGGEETEVIGSLEPGYWGHWAIVEKGIYYLDTTAKPGIVFFDFATRRTTRLFDLESRPAREAAGLGVSPDGKTILYTQLDALSRDIVLVENYR